MEKSWDEKLDNLKTKIGNLIFSEFGLESEIYDKNKNKNFIPKYNH